MQRKSFLQLAIRASWSKHLLAQTSFQLAPKAFRRAELISHFFCYSNSSKNITCPSDKLKTDFTCPIAKSTSPGLSDTTFFARWASNLGVEVVNSKVQVKGKLGHVVQIHICRSSVSVELYMLFNGKGGDSCGQENHSCQFSNLCLAKKEMLRYSWKVFTQWIPKNRSFERTPIEQCFICTIFRSSWR